jgi:hypothetical protein
VKSFLKVGTGLNSYDMRWRSSEIKHVDRQTDTTSPLRIHVVQRTPIHYADQSLDSPRCDAQIDCLKLMFPSLFQLHMAESVSSFKSNSFVWIFIRGEPPSCLTFHSFVWIFIRGEPPPCLAFHSFAWCGWEKENHSTEYRVEMASRISRRIHMQQLVSRSTNPHSNKGSRRTI